MRSARPATPLILLLFAGLLAGCGGNQIAADEVPVDPPVLTIPADSDAAPTSGNAKSNSSSSSATPTPTPSGTTSGGTSSGTTGGGTSSGTTGGTSSGTATPTPTKAAGTTGGAQADQGLDQFCADNPGAC